MSAKYPSICAGICLLAGLLTVAASGTAHAAECLSAPKAQSGPGTRWHYRIDHATSQRCWYLKQVGGPSRPRPTSERPATNSTPRSAGSEVEPSSTETGSSIKAWFSSTFSALSGSTTGTREPSISEPAVTPKRQGNERTEPRRQSKSEQQSKSEREQTEPARVPQRSSISTVSILEAAGDKIVPDAPIEPEEGVLKSAIEAVGDKDVDTPPPELEAHWQQALFEEFLQWRVKQLMLP